MMPPFLSWFGSNNIESRSFKCGYCGSSIASANGYCAKLQQSRFSNPEAFIYICHHCSRPTFFDFDGKQSPGALFGNMVNDITDESVVKIYQEARQAFGASCYTASVLCCRKLLMHIAVSKGATVGEPFVFYVEYLSTKNYVPPDAKTWVDQIRKKGNEANHEIFFASREEAQELISFSEMLLRLIFEFPAIAKRRTNL